MDTNNNKKILENCVLCPTCQGTGLISSPDISILNIKLNINDSKGGSAKARKLLNVKDEDKLPLSNIPKNTREVDFQDLSSIMENFLEERKEIENPLEMKRLALDKLKQNNCEYNISALKNILFLSKKHPDLVEPIMSIVYRKLSSLLQNIRHHIVIAAAQFSIEFFESMKYAQRPEFDELTAMILQKTAHMNKGVREHMNKALSVMIINISPWQCIRVLTSPRGAGHKNAEVRAAVSRVLESIINVIGIKNLLTLSNLKDTRRKIFITLAQFLIDGNQEARKNAREMIKYLLLTHNDFENCFYQDVDFKLFKKIEKEFISIKYE